MILRAIETIEKYPNGEVRYIETKALIAPMWVALYPNRRISDDGTVWIRTGINRKYNPDGSMEWEIIYDDYGNIIG